VVRVPGYRSRDPGLDFLERGLLSLMRITEEFERTVAAPV
jgi:hypothetical protein